MTPEKEARLRAIIDKVKGWKGGANPLSETEFLELMDFWREESPADFRDAMLEAIDDRAEEQGQTRAEFLEELHAKASLN